MMVLIMANINYLVILICSTVFLLSSFVSSQQKSKNAGDPREFYNYAVYLRTHHPEYYAKNYYGIIGHYNKLISATEAKRNPSYGGISKNNRKLKRNGPSVSNGQSSPSVSTTPRIITTPTTTTSDATQPLTTSTSTTEARATIEVANVSVPPNGTPLVKDSRPSKLKIGSKIVKRSSRSLNSTVSPEETAFANDTRAKFIFDLDWARKCFTLGYNNTNGSCQSEPEVIKLAPNETICRSYFELGCQYQLNRDLCVAAVDEVMKNTSFNCDFNINGDSEWMSVQCCMACKSGINAAISKDSCDMHLDNSMPSFAQEKCCNIFLNQNSSVSTTESIPVSFKPGSMNAIMSDLDDQVSNSTTFKLNNSLDSATESLKPVSLNEIIADLDDRFSNEKNKPEIDSSTVPETSTLPTTEATNTIKPRP